MDHNEYKTYLKHQYFHGIRPLQSVNDVISAFQKKIDIVETKLSESEEIFLKMTALNYINAQNNSFIEPSRDILNSVPLDTLNLVPFVVVRNEKSDHYYKLMEEATTNDERIIVIIESQLNHITSNCQELKVDLIIERGIGTSHVSQETPEFFAYLMLFDTYNENH